MNLPPGFRFNPFENELINLYLKRKVMGLELSCDVVEERELYGPCANPWQVFDPENYPWILSEVSCGKFEKITYAFVNLTKKAANSNNKNTVGKENYTKKAGCGTWDGQSKRPVRDCDGNLIGERRLLVFEINEVSDEEDLSRVGYWKMHQYNLCGINSNISNSSNTVLCKITLDHSKKAPIKLTTHSIKATAENNDTNKMNPVKMDVVTDSVQTCNNTFNDDDFDFVNNFFAEGEDGKLYVNMPGFEDYEFGSNPELGVEQTLEDVTTNMGKRKLQAETSYVRPLHLCVSTWNVAVVERWVELASKEEIADAIDVESPLGTSLCMAATLKKDHESEGKKIVHILLVAGADPTAQDNQHRRTALHTAAMSNDVELLKGTMLFILLLIQKR